MKRVFTLFLIAFVSIHCISCKALDTPPNFSEGPQNNAQNTPYLSDITIIIDAGHGGEDGGAVGANGIFEKNINLSVASMLETRLRNDGYKTLMTRTEDILLYDRNTDFEGHKKHLDLEARIKIAEETENALFISIHMNSFSQKKYKGLQVYYSPNSSHSKLLAEEIQLNARLLLDASNNRVTKESDGNILLLKRITHPAVLVECGFLSNTSECQRLSDPLYQAEIARTICISIENYINNENNTTAP